VSCSEISKDEFDKITPVKPPTVKRKIKPMTHHNDEFFNVSLPYIVLSHLNTLIPVGIAIIIVAEVK
jgi:hypothetical protein